MVASEMWTATLVQQDGDKTALRRNPSAVSLQFESSWWFHVIGDKMVVEIIKNVKSVVVCIHRKAFLTFRLT